MSIRKSTIVFLTIGGILVLGGGAMMAAGASMASKETPAVVSDYAEWENVSGLDIALGDCNLEIRCEKDAETCQVSFENMTRLPAVSMEGGTLVIEEPFHISLHFLDFGLQDKETGSVTIVLPQKEYSEFNLELGLAKGPGTVGAEISGLTAYEFDLSVGAGACVMEDITVTKNMKLEVGAGECTLNAVEVSGNCDIDLGAGGIKGSGFLCGGDVDIDAGVGELNLSEMQCYNLDFDGGVGDMNLRNLTLLGDMNLDCGVGDVELSLTGDASEYGVNADMGIGTIEFNGSRVGYFEGDHMIDVDGGVGDVSITTATGGTAR